jgi:hypothetical protein
MIYEDLITKNIIPFHQKILERYHVHTYSFYGKVKKEIIPGAHLTQGRCFGKGH